jgi:hypothetical protein
VPGAAALVRQAWSVVAQRGAAQNTPRDFPQFLRRNHAAFNLHIKKTKKTKKTKKYAALSSGAGVLRE